MIRSAKHRREPFRGFLSRALGTAVLGALVLASAPAVLGQRATERYIPIGKSPGLSGVHTMIGVVDRVDEEHGMVEMSEGSESYAIYCTDDTKFWLDRSKIRLTSLTGSLSDCAKGSRIEVKCFDDEAERLEAEWVKIEVVEAR
jgi:hypothetical protein